MENKIAFVERFTVEITGDLFREDAQYWTRADLADMAEEYVALGAGLAKPLNPFLSKAIPHISAWLKRQANHAHKWFISPGVCCLIDA